jgi:hypothetical protein
MLNQSKTARENPDSTVIVSWIHTHVQGAKCGYSSIDVHTQYGFSLFFPDFFGIVVELQSNGSIVQEAFTLSSIGVENVKKCSQTQNLSSVQHEECSSRHLFQVIALPIQYSSCNVEVVDARSSDSMKNLPVHHGEAIQDDQMEESDSDDQVICESCGNQYNFVHNLHRRGPV